MTAPATRTPGQAWRYGLMGLPLAFVALPLLAFFVTRRVRPVRRGR